eukprot:SAG11_NODE_8310_length_1031_cov_1.199571_2_plen_130_part_01
MGHLKMAWHRSGIGARASCLHAALDSRALSRPTPVYRIGEFICVCAFSRHCSYRGHKLAGERDWRTTSPMGKYTAFPAHLPAHLDSVRLSARFAQLDLGTPHRSVVPHAGATRWCSACKKWLSAWSADFF